MAFELNPSDMYHVPQISRDELLRRLRDPSLTIVDVLPATSYADSHIPRAINIPLEDLQERARDLLPKFNAEIAVYCGQFTWDRSERAVAQLNQLGYTNVRDYRAGLADWIEAGEPTEKIVDAAAPDTVPFGPPLTESPDGRLGHAQARISRMRRLDNSVLDLVQQRSTLALFLLWIGMILLCGFAYWIGAREGAYGLIEGGRPLGADLNGLGSAIYFSFVTATSIGYGDIVPVGLARAIAVAEAISALLIFGALVAKFVSRRQDQLMSEIHRTTFEERLDRVQTNLHMVISELLSITSLCESPNPPTAQIARRLESAALVFQGELRTTHDLLYQPRLVVEEGVLAAILAELSSALNILSDALACLPPGIPRTNPLQLVLTNVSGLATEICGECVPHVYTPRLVFWMDRIHATAARIK